MKVYLARRAVLLAIAVGAGAGCYSYRPVEQPIPGSAVRASLTVEGAVRQSEYLGQPTRSLSGKFVSTDAGEVRLDVITAQSRGTFNDIILRDTLTIPSNQIVVIEEREISWVRTGVIAVGGALIAAVAIGSITSGGENIEGNGPPPPSFDRIRFPLIRIGW